MTKKILKGKLEKNRNMKRCFHQNKFHILVDSNTNEKHWCTLSNRQDTERTTTIEQERSQMKIG